MQKKVRVFLKRNYSFANIKKVKHKSIYGSFEHD